jgi:signal transduction histidine kinase
LKASNNDGVWNEEGIAIDVTIVPPIWAAWWFRGLAILLLAAAVAGAYAWRIRNVELRGRELEHQVLSRTKELAALNSISAVVSRSLHLDEILSDALEKTLEVTGLEAGGIFLLEEDPAGSEGRVLRAAVQQGLGAEQDAGIDNLLVGEDFSGRVLETCEPLVIRDLSSEPEMAGSPAASTGFRSMIIAPVVSRAQVLGTLFVVTRGYRAFSDQYLDLLASIGGQIGVAVENARFFAAEQHRAEQFRVIAEVGRRIALIFDVDQVLEQVVDLMHTAFGYYHVAIGLVEGDEVVYHVGAGRLWEKAPSHSLPARLKIGHGVSGWVASTGQPLLIPDVSQEPRYVRLLPSQTRSELVVPIVVKGDVVGVLDVQSERASAFDETDLTVIQSLAHQTGAAIENARLYEQAQQTAVVEERSRLARELHDAVTQTLFSASLLAEALPSSWEMDPTEGRQLLKELRQLTRGALAEMRTLLLELRPTALVESGLGDLLRQLVEATSGRIGIAVELDVQGQAVLPPDVHVTFYRIAQEALNNVAKHARATRVEVRLDALGSANQPRRVTDMDLPTGDSERPRRRQRVKLRIRDNGRGFRSADARPDQLGLGIMRERAQAIGAEFHVKSEPGAGTKVTVIWEE